LATVSLERLKPSQSSLLPVAQSPQLAILGYHP
jgi:hypothetical protein